VYSRLISDIVNKCNIPLDEVHGNPIEIQNLKEQESRISRTIMDEDFRQNQAVNEVVQDKKKLERILKKSQKKTHALEVELANIDDRIKTLQAKQEMIDDCKETAPSMKETYTREYKTLLKKLEDAMKNFPDVYKEAENEANIHFLTPFK
jgi:chromosome segregation ATPase